MNWKRTRRTYLYAAKTDDEVSFVADSVVLPSGRQLEYMFVDCPYRVVAIVAMDDDSNVALIRQYRYVVDEMLYEVPAGSPVDGETLIEGACRELAEETGTEAAKLEELGTFYTSVGITNQRVTAFLARGLTKTNQKLDDSEHIEVHWTPLNEAVNMVRRGLITSQTAALSLLLVSLHMQSR